MSNVSFSDWFRTSLARDASRCFLQQGSDVLSYADLLEGAGERASVIGQHGVSTVVLDTALDLEFFLWLTAALLRGVTVVPWHRHKMSLDELVSRLPDHLYVGPSLREERRGGAPGVLTANEVYCLFTSGTTGHPKAVAVSQANVLAYVEGTREFLASRAAPCRASCVFSPVFDLFYHDYFVAIDRGWTLVLPDGVERLDLGRYVNRRALDIWFSTPTHAANIVSRVTAPVPVSLFCGEPLSVALASAWRLATHGERLYNLYGPTETTIAVTAASFDAAQLGRLDASMSVPIGTAFGGNRCIVSASNCELIVKGPQLARYLPPTASSSYYGTQGELDYSYRTGDVVRTVEVEGRFMLGHVGRKDRQLKINGHRVESNELEAVARALPGVYDARVVPVCDDLRCIGFDLHILGRITPEDVRGVFARRYGVAMLPRRVVITDEFPQDTSGKAAIASS